MQSDSPSRLLIALSKGFALPGLFSSKMSKLLEAVEIDEISVIQDEFHIARNYFADLHLSIKDEKPFARTSVKRKLKDYSHVVVFWDGEDLSDIVFFSQLNRLALRVVPVQITKVKNKDKDELFDIYIGRGTPWGNPFPIGIGGVGDTRQEVISKYREYFQNEMLASEDMRSKLLSLRGYRLGCHCKPQACHGDVIAEYLNTLEPNEEG